MTIVLCMSLNPYLTETTDVGRYKGDVHYWRPPRTSTTDCGLAKDKAYLKTLPKYSRHCTENVTSELLVTLIVS